MKRKIVFVIICLLLLLILMPKNPDAAFAQEVKEESDFLWEENADGTVTITGVRGGGSDVTKIVLPESILGKAVSAIGDEAFINFTKLKYIEIPDSVTKIGIGAFNYCSNLKELHLSEYVKELDYYGTEGYVNFYGTDAMVSIMVEEGNPVFTSADGALYSKDKRELLWVPNAWEGDFRIQEEVTSVASVHVFSNCKNITSVYIPEKIKNISSENFTGCTSLEEFIVSEINTSYFSEKGVLYYKDETSYRLMYIPAKKAGTAFSVPEAVNEIDYYAFFDCETLESVYIPANVKNEEQYMNDGDGRNTYYAYNYFKFCPRLKEIQVSPDNLSFMSKDGALYSKDEKILISVPPNFQKEYFMVPEGTEVISWQAIHGCKMIVSVTLPPSVRKICKNAFVLCGKLKEVVALDGLEQIESAAFRECEKLSYVRLPDSTLKKIGKNAFLWCQQLNKIEAGIYTYDLSRIVQSGDSWSLETDSKNEEIGSTEVDLDKLPDEPQSVLLAKEFVGPEYEAEGFSYCITTGNELIITGIANDMDASQIIDLQIPGKLGGKNVKGIASGAFSGENISTVKLPNGLKEIGSGAFYGCNLTGTVTIPATVSYIGERAFGANYLLEEIMVVAGNVTYESVNGALYNRERTILVCVPANYPSTSYNVPEGILVIGDYAFGNNRNIERLRLPDSIVKIESKAFWNMLCLSFLAIPEKQIEMAEDAIKHCYKLYTPTYRPLSVVGSSNCEIFYKSACKSFHFMRQYNGV